MSTKTTFKRIALVAVASLGFGVLSSVTPASASTAVSGTVTPVSVTFTGTALDDAPYARISWAPTLAMITSDSDPRVTMTVYTQVLDNEIDDVGLLLSKAAGF